jgi:hypothetical protein
VNNIQIFFKSLFLNDKNSWHEPCLLMDSGVSFHQSFKELIMFKKSLAALFLMVSASASHAAFISCTPAQADTVINAAGTNATFTCNPGAGSGAGSADDNLAGDGYTLTQIRLRLSGAFQENAAPTGSNYSVSFSSSNLLSLPTPGCTASGSENGSGQALGNCVSTSAFSLLGGALDVLASFMITVTGAPGSTPLPFNASSSISYEVVAVPTETSVPVPASVMLLGVGLLSFAATRRRR